MSQPSGVVSSPALLSVCAADGRYSFMPAVKHRFFFSYSSGFVSLLLFHASVTKTLRKAKSMFVFPSAWVMKGQILLLGVSVDPTVLSNEHYCHVHLP